MKTGSSWTQKAKLTASDGKPNDDLGLSVGVSSDGSTIVAGAVGSNSFQGAAYVFVKTGSSWTQKAKLTASDGMAGDELGYSVGVSSDGSTIVAGARGSNSFQGAAYVFVKCSPAKPDVDGDGHEKGDDGREGQFQFCKSSDEMDFEERDSNGRIFGQPLRAKMNAVTVSGNQAIITGSGTLADGTPVNYTAVVLGNQPVIGANTFAISWVTATGSVFQTSGPLTDGYIVVH